MVDGAHITVVTVKMHPSFVQVSSQPRPQGFFLKKKNSGWYTLPADARAFYHPTHFLNEKHSGRVWLSSDRKQVSV